MLYYIGRLVLINMKCQNPECDNLVLGDLHHYPGDGYVKDQKTFCLDCITKLLITDQIKETDKRFVRTMENLRELLNNPELLLGDKDFGTGK